MLPNFYGVDADSWCIGSCAGRVRCIGGWGAGNGTVSTMSAAKVFTCSGIIRQDMNITSLSEYSRPEESYMLLLLAHICALAVVTLLKSSPDLVGACTGRR